MSQAAESDGWCPMSQAIEDFRYEDWMGIAEYISALLSHFGQKCLDLSIGNFKYHKETKRCLIINKGAVEHNDDPIKLRWYPQRIWNKWSSMFCYKQEIAARVVLEFMYGRSMYYHEDETTYRENIVNQDCTILSKDGRDHKAAWMLLYTATIGPKLTDGQRFLRDLEEKEGKDPDDVIAHWDDDVSISEDESLDGESEHDSGLPSPQKKSEGESSLESSDEEYTSGPENVRSVGVQCG